MSKIKLFKLIISLINKLGEIRCSEESKKSFKEIYDNKLAEYILNLRVR